MDEEKGEEATTSRGRSSSGSVISGVFGGSHRASSSRGLLSSRGSWSSSGSSSDQSGDELTPHPPGAQQQHEQQHQREQQHQHGSGANDRGSGGSSGESSSSRISKPAPRRSTAVPSSSGKLRDVAQKVKSGVGLLSSHKSRLKKDIAQTDWIAKTILDLGAHQYRLNLYGCKISDSGALRLSLTLGTSEVRELYLTFNRIGDVGANAIAKAVANNRCIEDLGEEATACFEPFIYLLRAILMYKPRNSN
eukprot:COSAG06_NODE_3260_length_5603_cov_5.564135_2_plen_249_part_00